MFRLGRHICCDRCQKIIVTGFDWCLKPFWDIVNKARQHGSFRRMDFCDERCRMIHFRGRKYWQRKLLYMRRNGVPVVAG